MSKRFEQHGQGEVTLGHRTSVSADVQFIFSKPGRVRIGDYCVLGPGVKFVCNGGDVTLGDWCSIHDRGLVLAEGPVDIGPHCWFGQNAVLDGTGGLTIEFGVRAGMNTQIWSHVATGEQIEGCTLYGMDPVHIEPEVWLVGGNAVAPGVRLGRRSVILSGANVTRSCEPLSVLAGLPAVRKPGLSFYEPVTLDQKWQMLGAWLEQLSAELQLDLRALGEDQYLVASEDAALQGVAFARRAEDAAALRAMHADWTVCCVQSKTYNKQRSELEYRVLKYLAGNKARFFALS
ncbi:MAG: hypothetical protein IV092_05935 [Burkholderiaceae bacterium]|nr:hypothetical protein [Burkholderiaceae bacterium]